MRGQAGIAAEGYGANQYVSAMYGTNFADGRGNITLHGEYARQERIFALRHSGISDRQRDRHRRCRFGRSANNSDGFPDRVFLRDIRGTTIHPFGLIPITQPAGGAGSAATAHWPTMAVPNAAGPPYNCTYFFTADGRLVQQTGARYSTGQFGGILGGNGATNRETIAFGVLPFARAL